MTEPHRSGEPGPEIDGGADDEPAGDVDVRPLGESPFAVGHGLVGAAPDVAVAGPAVRRARELAGLAVPLLCEDMARRGEPLSPDELTALEARPATRLPSRRARLLAALVDRPLVAVEARAEPWPAQPDAVASLAAAGADVLVLGDEVVVPTSSPNGYLGVLRCDGDAAVLDTRTYRFAAARLLNGDWAHLAGALLVCAERPLRAVAVDALDCVTRSHAPSGLLGFSRLAEPELIPDALRTYDRSYVTNWSDPEPLRADDVGSGLLGVLDDTAGGHRAQPRSGDVGHDSGRLMARLADLADRLGDESRRSRQAGKRPGYEHAAQVLRSLTADEVVDQLSRLAAAEQVARARAGLAELLGQQADEDHEGHEDQEGRGA